MTKDRQKANAMAAVKSVRERLARPTNQPTHSFIEVTTKCNLSCIQCNRVYVDGYIDGSLQGDISLDLVKKLAPVLPDMTSLTATGFGEPFMNPEVISILRFLKPFGGNLGMISNGMLFTEEIARAVLAIGMEEIWFSIDSPDPQTFHRIRVGAELDQVVTNITRLSRLRDEAGSPHPKIAIEFVAMAKNFLQLPGLPALAKEMGCYKVVVQKLFNSPDQRYARFYQRNNLTNVELEAGMAGWKEFLGEMEKQGLELESYLGDDPTPLFKPAPKEETGKKVDYPEFLACLDGPLPFSSNQGKLEVLGWVQGLRVGPEVTLWLENGEDRFSWPLNVSDSRPDVVAALPDVYMPKEKCGFSAEIDIAALPPAKYTIYLNVDNSTEPGAKHLGRGQVYINMAKDMSMYCTQPWSTIYVSWEGEVKPCCFSNYVLGNLKTRTITEIWQGEEAVGLRQQMIDGVVNEYCVDCVNSGYPVDFIGAE